MTRHHDGYVRQRHLEPLVAEPGEWVVPFVVQLLGEYVVEIHEAILARLLPILDRSADAREAYRRFVAANPDFIAVTEARIASYWNCYYRDRFVRYRRRDPDGPRYPGDYPASIVLEALGRLTEGAMPA